MEKMFSTRFGSFLYGTSTPTSDVDIKHVILPALDDILVGKHIKNKVKKTNNIAFTKNSVDDVDEEFIPIQTLAHDFLGGQTYALELVFSIDGSEAHQEIHNQDFVAFCKELRTKFLTSNVRAMIGYAVNQASIYSAKGERLNALRAVEEVFKSAILANRRETKISDGSVFFEYDMANVSSRFPKYVNLEEYAINPEGEMRPCVKVLEKVIPYSSTFENGLKVVKAALKRYGSRADAASVDIADWKALAHAVRIVHEGNVLLTTHKLSFPFKAEYCQHLLNIKNGGISFEEVSRELNTELERLKTLEKTCPLPIGSEEMKRELDNWLASWMRTFYKL